MVEVSLKCQCGNVRGIAHNISPRTVTRVVCYCDDCQTFARYLENEGNILDPYGGTDIFQLTPAQIYITQGSEHLRCIRLGPKGLIRWYTACCKTPVGNTLSESVPFVGMVHSFLDNVGDRDKALGPVRFYLHGKFATGAPLQKIHNSVPLTLLARNIPKILLAKLLRQNQPSPFFRVTGEPISEPTIVDKSQ